MAAVLLVIEAGGACEEFHKVPRFIPFMDEARQAELMVAPGCEAPAPRARRPRYGSHPPLRPPGRRLPAGRRSPQRQPTVLLRSADHRGVTRGRGRRPAPSKP